MLPRSLTARLRRGALLAACAAVTVTTASTTAGAQVVPANLIGNAASDGRGAAGTNSLATGSLGGAAGSAAELVGGPDYRFVVIGDLPYGDAQDALLPVWIDDINSAAPRFTVHVGDTKNGSTECSDAHRERIKEQFDRFTMPLIYSPGDNEWTDCHRSNNGGYDPLERLQKLRETFFAEPGRTLGVTQPVEVVTPSVPENVTWQAPGLAFGAVHLVGSNNGLQPWEGRSEKTANPAQIAAERERSDAALATLDAVFAQAQSSGAQAVVLFQQADMMEPGVGPEDKNLSAFKPYVKALAEHARAFAGPVYLFDGDSHVMHVDRPLADASPWASYYEVPQVPNLTRITVNGSQRNTGYLEVTRHALGTPEALTWVQRSYSAWPPPKPGT